MKLLVVSDSHGAADTLLAVAEREMPLDALIFLGDGESGRDLRPVAELFPALPLVQVRGNCDVSDDARLEALASFGGVLFLCVHGHTHRVRLGSGLLLRAARRAGAGAALYGHTHMAALEIKNGVALFNPGSLASSRAGPNSYGVVTVQNHTADFKIVPV